MRQTVIGVYDSYVDACSAQRALCEAGVSQADISIYSTSASAPVEKGPRVYAPGGGARHHPPVFDQLEQLFARLFQSGEYPPEAEDYREFIRRGGTVVSADVSEMQVDLARDVMRRTGAADIEERMSGWRNGAGKADTTDVGTGAPYRGSAVARESALQNDSLSGEADGSMSAEDRPVLGGSSDVTEGTMASPSVSRQAWDELPPTARDFPATENDEALRPADRPTMVGGMEQVTTRTAEPGAVPPTQQQTQRQTTGVPDIGLARSSADVSERLRGGIERAPDRGMSATQAEPAPVRGLVGDPVMGTPFEDDPYDDEFRKDFDAHYASSGGTYDEYRRAYAHGTTLGQDERYREQDWQRIEPSAREDWESRYPESGWERFKAAVRHGWERVSGH
jgi:hypothetical protein